MFWASKSVPFHPKTDIPPLTDKVILVTGGNVGLGKQAILEYARHGPLLIWLAARSVQKANAAANEIREQVPDARIQVLELDLASFDSIKKAAATVLAESSRLDILMLNAGIMATAPGLTIDGYELQFGTNHMGHALLTKLLLPLLDKTNTLASKSSSSNNNSNNPDGMPPAAGDVRIISLSSHGHTYAGKGGIDFATLQTRAEAMSALGRYSQSKLANVLWVRQLARAHPQLTVAAVHPGVVRTQLMERATGTPAIVRALTRAGSCLLTPVDQGVRNQLWASVAAGVESGEYYGPVGVAGLASADGRDEALARRFWAWTERELQGHVV